MKVYHLERKQFLPITLSEAWSFFSKPRNLAHITPANMHFQILHISGGQKMYEGQIIHYKIDVLPNVPTQWVTEITHVQEPYRFIDEQRSGPYAMWHHQHIFKEKAGGVEVIDEVNYALPFGFIGRLANQLFVEQKLNTIFDYRYNILEKHFVKDQPKTTKRNSPWITPR